jgi:hypothetical protein
MRRARAVATALLWSGITLGLSLQASQPARDADALPALLGRVAESVTRYFARAQSIICIETVRVQALGLDFLPDGPSRRLDYELRVAWDPAEAGEAPEATVRRQLVKVNGRVPRPKDEPGCMDPKDVSAEPLSMFLPDQQAELIFSISGSGKVGGRRAVILDFKSRQAGDAKITGTKDCLSFELPGRARGRAWIDAETDDVLRLDTHLTGIFDFTVPRELQQVGGAMWMTIERYDSSIVYKPVAFEDPEERLMLPASIDTLSVIRNSGSPRTRISQSFSNYRRFITGGRIVQ